MAITIQQTIYQSVPTGKYLAKITEIEEVDGQFGKQLKFHFELSPGDNGEPRSLLGWASKKFSSNSKLYGWTQAAVGPIDPTYTFNSDDLINRKVMLVVTEKQGEKGMVNSIAQVLPYTKPQPVPQPNADW